MKVLNFTNHCCSCFTFEKRNPFRIYQFYFKDFFFWVTKSPCENEQTKFQVHDESLISSEIEFIRKLQHTHTKIFKIKSQFSQIFATWDLSKNTSKNFLKYQKCWTKIFCYATNNKKEKTRRLRFRFSPKNLGASAGKQNTSFPNLCLLKKYLWSLRVKKYAHINCYCGIVKR